MSKKNRFEDAWDARMHEKRKAAKAEKAAKTLMAQVYEALDVEPAEYVELKDSRGQVVYRGRITS